LVIDPFSLQTSHPYGMLDSWAKDKKPTAAP